MAAAAPPSPLDPGAASAALDGLLRWLAAQAKHKNAQLLEYDEPVQVLVSLRKIPAARRLNPHLISLPHPPARASLCLLVDDRPHAAAALPLDAVEAKIRSDALPISEVIPLGSLRSDYASFEAHRKLCGSHDLFFADRRILPLLPRLLGKVFFKKKKLPLKIDLSHRDWLSQIRRGCGAACLYVRTGTCCHLNVGTVSMPKDEILENLVTAVNGAVGFIPKGWKNVRAVYLKLEESVALPIYQALPEIGMKIDVAPKDGGGAQSSVGKDLEGEKVVEKKTMKRRKKKGRTTKEVRYVDRNLDHDPIGDSEEESEGVVEEDAGTEVKVMGARKKNKRKKEGVEEEEGTVVSKKGKKSKKNGKKMGGEKNSEIVVELEEGMDGMKREEGEDAEEIIHDADEAGAGETRKNKPKKEKIKRRKINVEDLKGSVGSGDHGGEDAVMNARKKKKKADVAARGEATVEVVCDVDGGDAGELIMSGLKKEKVKKGKKSVKNLKGSVGIGDRGRKDMVKEVDDVKEDAAAVEAVNVSDIVGLVATKNKSKPVDRCKELKKIKKRKTNS